MYRLRALMAGCIAIAAAATAATEELETARTKSVASNPILVNAWYRDTVIHVALINRGEDTVNLRVAVGARGVSETHFAQRTVEAHPRSFQMTAFPAVTRKDGMPADHVFVSGPGLRDQFQVIQHANLERSNSTVTHSVLHAGENALFEYTPAISPALQLIFIPKTIEAAPGKRCIAGPVSTAVRPLSEEELKTMELPASYRQAMLARAEDNFAYLLPPGARDPIRIRYTTPQVSDAVNVAIPFYRYIWGAGGGPMRAGGGVGAVLTLYNPEKIQPMFDGITIINQDAATTGKKQ